MPGDIPSLGHAHAVGQRVLPAGFDNRAQFLVAAIAGDATNTTVTTDATDTICITASTHNAGGRIRRFRAPSRGSVCLRGGVGSKSGAQLLGGLRLVARKRHPTGSDDRALEQRLRLRAARIDRKRIVRANSHAIPLAGFDARPGRPQCILTARFELGQIAV